MLDAIQIMLGDDLLGDDLLGAIQIMLGAIWFKSFKSCWAQFDQRKKRAVYVD